MPDRERLYLSETLFVDADSHIRALKMAVSNETSVTTWTSPSSGYATASYLSDIVNLFRTPVLDDVRRMQMYSRQHVYELLSSYNIAILLGPLATSLMPASAIADVTPLLGLPYLLLTDVFAMLPLLIKGTELVSLSKQSQSTVHARIFDSLDQDYTATALIWSTTCNAREHMYRKGISLLVTAIVLMLLGKTLEVVFRIKLYKGNQHILCVRMPRNLHQEQLWMQSNIGSRPTCDSYVLCNCVLVVEERYTHI